MIRKLQSAILSLALVLGVSSMFVAPVGAINAIEEACRGGNRSTSVCQARDESINPLIRTVINTLLMAIGIIAVIMIIVGGIRYTLSNGDSSNITNAKNTILYSVIGLVVALLAYAIVNFVVSRF